MATDEQALRISEYHVRKEINVQLEALNKTLATLTDQLTQVHKGLADVSDAIRSSAAMNAEKH